MYGLLCSVQPRMSVASETSQPSRSPSVLNLHLVSHSLTHKFSDLSWDYLVLINCSSKKLSQTLHLLHIRLSYTKTNSCPILISSSSLSHSTNTKTSPHQIRKRESSFDSSKCPFPLNHRYVDTTINTGLILSDNHNTATPDRNTCGGSSP